MPSLTAEVKRFNPRKTAHAGKDMENAMGSSKEQWIAETGGFRIGESADIELTRRRVRDLAHKLKDEGLSDEERAEYIRLIDSLPDDE